MPSAQSVQINQSVTLCLILNATNTKAEGTRIADEVRTVTTEGQTKTIRAAITSRTTPQDGGSANRVRRATHTTAVASNWDFEEAGEGGGCVDSICGGSTDSICG